MLKVHRFFCRPPQEDRTAAEASDEAPSREKLEEELASCRSRVQELEREKARLQGLVEELQLAARIRERPAPQVDNPECYRSDEGRVYGFRIVPARPTVPSPGQADWRMAMKWADELRRRRFAEEKLADALAYIAHLQTRLNATEQLVQDRKGRRRRNARDLH